MAPNAYFSYPLFIISLLTAFVLSILPLPLWAVWFRPEWVLMVVFYWVIANPERLGLAFAWLIGILLDALNGTVLGEHALALIIPVFIIQIWSRRRVTFPYWQTILFIGLMIFVYKLILWLVQGLIGQFLFSMYYFISVLISMVFWPWIEALLTLKQHKKYSRVS